jgi:hypothetical protein
MHAVMKGDAIDFIIEEPASTPTPVVNEEGYIVLDQFKPKV